MRALALFALPLMSILIGPVIVFASAPVEAHGAVLVISRWGDRTEQVVAAAGGQVYGPVRAPLGVLAFSDDPAFADNLRAAGAWAVLAGDRIATICGADT
ncbi:MAG: hypothetical protein KDK28_21230 [Maritimibacter sp.]|nr:hypothetical protein [Maritimibacter sp.]